MTNRISHTVGDTPVSGLAGWVLLAFLSTALIGCDSLPTTRFVSGLSAEERALAARLPVYREGLPEGSYQIIGPVKGYSCQITHDDGYRMSEDNAIAELQRASIKAGANAVIEVACERLGRRQGTRGCYRSVVCQGIAVQKT